MNAGPPSLQWIEANQKWLSAEFARLVDRLSPGAATGPTAEAAEAEAAASVVGPAAAAPAEKDQPPALERICDAFALSSFEREVLLLCAGIEMDSRLAAWCSHALENSRRGYATFGLALAALKEPHWSALTPDRPLRRFRLIELETGHGITSAPLRIDERILHFLAGINLPDARLQCLLRSRPYPQWIAPSQQLLAERVAEILEAPAPIIQLCGDDVQGQLDIADAAAHARGRQLFTARAEDIPAPGPELEQFITLWQRESLLIPGALLIECGTGALGNAARQLLERLSGMVILTSREPIHLLQTFRRFDVDKPEPAQQRSLWQRALGPAAAGLNGALDAVSQQFRLSAKTIHATSAAVSHGDAPMKPGDLWNACRSQSQPRLEDLAQRIVPRAQWCDLVLPELQERTLRQLASQVRHRMTVFETWGFSARGRRGLGVSALFSGESGTGKTLAAEVLAHDLSLDLYRIDLSSVVSKYIGETEKNLKRVFDAAEEGGAILLFDEADALFGKRGEVKDSHDRYANIEVSYLLQRMETYQGLAILTTNLKSSMDKAFQRRLRFSVHFPFPDARQREAIWARVFPAGTPTRDLDVRKLSQLNVTGGNIVNIALNAAFLAAEFKAPVGMEHLVQAARLEAQKVERPVSDAEIRGWA